MINSNDKVSIRTMIKFMNEAQYNKQVLRRINTGSNVYTVICEYKPLYNSLDYSVNKTSKSGKDMGITNIVYVTIDEVISDKRMKLPDSVIKYIKEYNLALAVYRDYGEEGFKKFM